jgi:hypothetical protein
LSSRICQTAAQYKQTYHRPHGQNRDHKPHAICENLHVHNLAVALEENDTVRDRHEAVGPVGVPAQGGAKKRSNFEFKEILCRYCR